MKVRDHMRLTLALFAILVFLSHVGCGGSTPTSPSGNQSSTTTSSTSHNAGRDCLGCHSFTVAGTAYRADGTTPNPGVVIRLTTASAGGGTVVTSLTADGSGNFYSSGQVSFGTGLYVTATNSAASVRSMSATITSGACNRCHTSGNRIVLD